MSRLAPFDFRLALSTYFGAPPPRRPAPVGGSPPAAPTVGSGASAAPRPRAGKAKPSCDGPFCTKRVSGLSGCPVRYCCPALPQYLPALSVALWLIVSSLL